MWSVLGGSTELVLFAVLLPVFGGGSVSYVDAELH